MLNPSRWTRSHPASLEHKRPEARAAAIPADRGLSPTELLPVMMLGLCLVVALAKFA